MPRVLSVLGFLLVTLGWAGAQSPGLVPPRTLDNGMEIFVYRNANVPLATVQITFRCGAIGQTPENAGLFHLYEHMMFKGNDAFADEKAFNAAMTELGVSGWNGGTSNEYVNYYITVPSDKTAKGIDFWAHAVMNPKLDPKDLEVERNVVLNEVKGYWADPGEILDQAMTKKLFYKFPWRRDVSGDQKDIENATVAQLRAIQQTYYIPNNASLQVSGDVDPEKVYAWAQASFGGWKRGADPWAAPPPAHPFMDKPAKIWFAHPSMYQGIGSVTLRLRGPDVLTDDGSTYAADVWSGLLENPGGRFKKAIQAKVPGLYQIDYVSAQYLTQRDGGSIDVTAYLVKSAPDRTLAQEAEAFEKAVREEMTAMAQDPTYFTDDDFNAVKKRHLDSEVYDRETASGYANELSFWWASANTSYYLAYDRNFAKVKRADLVRYLDLYWSKPGVLALFVNPADAGAAPGWEQVTKDNAFWWKGTK